MPSAAPENDISFGMQLPIQTLTRTLCDPWEDTAQVSDLVSVAQTAEASGMDFIGVCDHIAIPDNDYAKHMTTTWYDTVATLSYLAAHTERVRLLSVVWVAAYRHPLQTAKAFGTLDHLSGGRAIFGVGAGHVEAEFDALGVDFATRGKRLDETLDAISGAFADTYVSHQGEHYQYTDVGVAPAPAGGELTMWVGGGGKAALRRVGQFGHGFIPFTQSPADYPEVIATIAEAAETAGRSDQHFAIGAFAPRVYLGEPPDGLNPVHMSGSADQIAAAIRGIAGLGANTIHCAFRGRDRAEYEDQVRRFGAEVMPLVREG
ncbi:MAG: TIGR03619 family F420-dependent LLM class oxidoreductase [Acidimicrobiales bacterium]